MAGTVHGEAHDVSTRTRSTMMKLLLAFFLLGASMALPPATPSKCNTVATTNSGDQYAQLKHCPLSLVTDQVVVDFIANNNNNDCLTTEMYENFVNAGSKCYRVSTDVLVTINTMSACMLPKLGIASPADAIQKLFRPANVQVGGNLPNLDTKASASLNKCMTGMFKN